MSNAGRDAAFRATTYRVDAGDALYELRVGVVNGAFDACLRRRGVSCWGLVTAYNPGVMALDAANQAAQNRLRDRLRALEWSSLPACNLPDDGISPVEPSFLLLEVSEKEVRTLAVAFFQLAFLCANTGSAPRLVYVDPPGKREGVCCND